MDANGQPIKDDKGRFIWNEVPLGTATNPTPEAPWYRAIGKDEKTLPAHGWMIGYAPADKPKVAFAVLVEYGGGGGSAAGSIVKTMLEACIQQGYLAGK
ncbi:MAG: penicillin-binding transpeptidase domain-containing protein [Tepidisphaeraceae bacterium]